MMGFLLTHTLVRDLFILLLSSQLLTDYGCDGIDITIDGKQCIHEADARFLSIALDCSLISSKWKTFNMKDSGVVAMAKALSPGILRIGGTTCDYEIFNTTEINTNKDLDFILTVFDWDSLVNFTREANLTLLYDSNVMRRDVDGNWDPSNFRKFLDYNQRKKVTNLLFELGNEPNNYPAHFNRTITAEQMAKDFARMRSVLNEYPMYKSHLLVGADVGNPYLRTNIGLDPATYIQQFLRYGYKSIDALTWHQYYLKGSTAQVKDFLNVEILNEFEQQVMIVEDIIEHVLGHDFPVWMGETSSAYNSGAANISNTYVAGFLWLDKLGVCARYGYDIVIRQTFYDGWYALISHSLNPYPDFWLSVLYKQLVGTKSLNVERDGLNSTKVRMYAHCTLPSAGFPKGAITVYALNLDSLNSATIDTQYTDSKLSAYILTPVNNVITSTDVQLNRQTLKLHNQQLPKLLPVQVTAINLKPQTFGFFIIENANAPICF